jgi:hypothetical protein
MCSTAKAKSALDANEQVRIKTTIYKNEILILRQEDK